MRCPETSLLKMKLDGKILLITHVVVRRVMLISFAQGIALSLILRHFRSLSATHSTMERKCAAASHPDRLRIGLHCPEQFKKKIQNKNKKEQDKKTLEVWLKYYWLLTFLSSFFLAYWNYLMQIMLKFSFVTTCSLFQKAQTKQIE